MKRVILYAIPVLLGAFSIMSRTSDQETTVLLAQNEPAAEDLGPDAVSDEQMKLYIDIYSAMQMDHSLTLDDALEPHHMTMEEFRGIERHVQNKSRLVSKVRAALLEQAMQRSAFSEPVGQPAAAAKRPETKKP